jgi:hypothetical protein
MQSAYVSTFQSTQIGLKNIGLIQNPWIIGRSVNNKKCSKFDFLPPQNFADFSQVLAIFPRWKSVLSLFQIGKPAAEWGPPVGVSIAGYHTPIGGRGRLPPVYFLSGIKPTDLKHAVHIAASSIPR